MEEDLVMEVEACQTSLAKEVHQRYLAKKALQDHQDQQNQKLQSQEASSVAMELTPEPRLIKAILNKMDLAVCLKQETRQRTV